MGGFSDKERVFRLGPPRESLKARNGWRGSIRRVSVGGNTLRQVLLAHSDLDRMYSYAFASELSAPAHNYLATIRVTPVTDSGKAFVEWWATFDCATQDYERLIDTFENKGFAVWLGALRQFMKEGRGPT